MSVNDTVESVVKQYGQEHILKFQNELNEEQKQFFLENINEIDFSELNTIFTASDRVENLEERLLPPPSEVCGSLTELRSTNKALLDEYRNLAIDAIRQGKVAVLLLAGGQGTRLGVPYPKGMYKPSLPSGRSLYQLQAECILHTAELARKDESSPAPTIPWYIMTSEHTKQITMDFFEKHNYFGHKPSNVVFFEQFTLPVFGMDGKLILDQKHKLSRAPDGNGGIYRALKSHGILENMALRGVEYVQIYCVDNILVKLPDLNFIGFCLSKSAECGNEVIQKVQPNEPIGVMGVVDGRYQVVEYSEISPSTAALTCDQQGDQQKSPTRLLYSRGNIAIHFMTRDFLARVSEPDFQKQMRHHVAKKKIPYVDMTSGQRIVPAKPNGIKLEKFVFDVFPFADRFAIWEVPRDEFFSPLKNSDESGVDCPRTIRNSLLSYHTRLARQAGAVIAAGKTEQVNENHTIGSNGQPTGDDSKTESWATCVEISPLISSSGENLSFLNGVTLRGQCLIELDADSGKPKIIQL